MKFMACVFVVAFPAVAMAQDKAAMCVDLLEAADTLAADAAAMADSAAAFHNEMLAMRNRIGGADGAALEMKSERRLDDVAEEVSALRRDAEAAREIVLAYCS